LKSACRQTGWMMFRFNGTTKGLHYGASLFYEHSYILLPLLTLFKFAV